MILLYWLHDIVLVAEGPDHVDMAVTSHCPDLPTYLEHWAD